MPLPPKVKAGCGAATLFLAGALTGVVAMFILLILLIPRIEGWKKDDSKDFLADHLAKKLNLTEEQKIKLRPGFNHYLNERWNLRAGYLKSDREILEKYLSTVEPELTPAQQEKAKIIKKRWWDGKKTMVRE
ncbi:MAG: hypothetical protein P1U89_11890 [Verrucomicrobiales bacterium]|nr:hypothetical protein [Verrucomicrobiales bacterium]